MTKYSLNFVPDQFQIAEKKDENLESKEKISASTFCRCCLFLLLPCDLIYTYRVAKCVLELTYNTPVTVLSKLIGLLLIYKEFQSSLYFILKCLR